MERFCYICGARAVHEGYCERHWGEKNPLVSLPKEIEIVQCPKCDLIKKGRKWVQPNYNDVIKAHAKIHGEVDQWLFSPLNDKIEIQVNGWLKGRRKEEVHIVRLKIIKRICDICSRIASGYYEAKLQLRGQITGPVLAWIRARTAELAKRNRKAFYRHKLLKEGIDLYFGSKSAARAIARGLKEKYGAEIKESFKVVGRKDGRQLKRVIICARFGGQYEPVPNIYLG